MIEIKEHVLYTRRALADLLGDALDVDLFLGRIKARKVFKGLWLGEDLLNALRAAPALGDERPAPRMPKARRRKGRSKGDDAASKPLDDYMREVRGHAKTG